MLLNTRSIHILTKDGRYRDRSVVCWVSLTALLGHGLHVGLLPSNRTFPILN